MTELRGTTSGNNPQGSAVSATLLERPGPVAIIYIYVYMSVYIYISIVNSNIYVVIIHVYAAMQV